MLGRTLYIIDKHLIIQAIIGLFHMANQLHTNLFSKIPLHKLLPSVN